MIVREDDFACAACPITTYNGQGVARRGAKRSDHCIVYSTKDPPNLVPGEEASNRDEPTMQPYSIKVDPQPGEKLDPLSRIDFAKPQTIHNYVKVKTVGHVNSKSINHLVNQFRLVITQGAAAVSKSEPTMSSVPGPSTTSRDRHTSAYSSSGACGYSSLEVSQRQHHNAYKSGEQGRDYRAGSDNAEANQDNEQARSDESDTDVETESD